MTLNVTKKLRLCENYPMVHKKTLFVDLTCLKECNKVSLVQFVDTANYGVLPMWFIDVCVCVGGVDVCVISNVNMHSLIYLNLTACQTPKL